MMMTLISGTSRLNSNSRKVANQYLELLAEKGYAANLLDLSELAPDCFGPCSEEYLHPGLKQVQEDWIRPATHLLFVVPEYNGSIPGVLKALLDFTEIKAWYGKKACLAGVATGRAGNLRGLDHLGAILMHCKIKVLPYTLPISTVGKLLSPEGRLDEGTRTAISRQLDEFLVF